MNVSELEPRRTNEAVRKSRRDGPHGEQLFDVSTFIGFTRQLEFELELTIADRDRRCTQAQTLAQYVTKILKLVLAIREERVSGDDVVRFAELLRDAKRVADAVMYGE